MSKKMLKDKSEFLNNFKKRLKKLRYTHNLAAKYYAKLYNRLTFPTIILTALVSIGGFISSSEIFADTKNIITITIGVLGSVSTVFQSISHSCEYSTKKTMFEKAADDYDKLLSKLYFGQIPSKDPESNSKFIQDIQREVIKIKNECKYLPPLFANDKWRVHKNRKKKETSEDVNETTPLIKII